MAHPSYPSGDVGEHRHVKPVSAVELSGWSRWRAAICLGLVSSTFSTVVSQLSAGRIGRDAAVDWMSVAAIPARDWALSAEPSSLAVAIGIAFHQWADFSWALFFFGALGKWTERLSPLALLLAAIPWAVFTSALEWLLLVPLFPFWQPIFTLQQPYWIGFLVHLSSALIYPLFAWLRWPLGQAPASRSVRFAKFWGLGAVAVLSVAAALGFANAHGFALPLLSRDVAADQTYIRHMTTHHAQGIELARLGAARAQDPHLRHLAALMAASQAGENRIFNQWWRGWFDQSMELCSSAERSAMPGYLTPAQMAEARDAPPTAFDATFVRLMSLHHAGAVRMADVELHGRGDPRLRVMAHAIRHEQQGEIGLMNGLAGIDAVRAALRNMMRDNLTALERTSRVPG
jgi:uncharacterized protein (DUF305 family)